MIGKIPVAASNSIGRAGVLPAPGVFFIMHIESALSTSRSSRVRGARPRRREYVESFKRRCRSVEGDTQAHVIKGFALS